MLNCAVIMGRLTATPELKTTTSGKSVTSFTVAVERTFAKQGEERQTDFINVVAWRGTADFVTRFFQKGQMIAVQGRIETRNYEDKNGNKRTAVEVIADNVSFCGSKSENTVAEHTEPQPTYSTADGDSFSVLPDASQFPFSAEDSDEGLPF